MRPASRALLAVVAVLAAAVVSRTGLHAKASFVPAPGLLADVRQDLPDGPGKEVVARLCDGCHDLMFTLSTRETEEEWTRIVNDMRSRGTDGTEAEFQQVIAYLTRHMGKAAPEAHAAVALTANRSKVAPGARFALGLRVAVADGWRLQDDPAAGRSPRVSWTMPEGVTVGDSGRPVRDPSAAFIVFPAILSPSVEPGATLAFAAGVDYEVCRETCVTETATVSLTVPVGEGGVPIHEAEFARAGVASSSAR